MAFLIPSRKNKLYNRYTINELLRKGKTSYYKYFFTEHNNNIKKVWEGIKEIVSIKSKNINNPTSIQH